MLISKVIFNHYWGVRINWNSARIPKRQLLVGSKILKISHLSCLSNPFLPLLHQATGRRLRQRQSGRDHGRLGHPPEAPSPALGQQNAVRFSLHRVLGRPGQCLEIPVLVLQKRRRFVSYLVHCHVAHSLVHSAFDVAHATNRFIIQIMPIIYHFRQ